MNSIKVLVIDSNTSFVDEINKYFSDSASIDICYKAYDGCEGLRIIKEHKEDYNLIILDLILPSRDGLYILEEMKSSNIIKKVIIMTSYRTEEMIKKASLMGVNYYLIKPVELSYLKKRIISCFEISELVYHDYSIQEYITKILHELGVPSHIKGYLYIRDGILFVYDEPNYINGNNIYSNIAKTYCTSNSCVERAIRHAIDISWNRGNWDLMEEVFGHSIDLERAKPTNLEYIITVADKLRIDYNKTLFKEA